jgi:hypothetical protein
MVPTARASRAVVVALAALVATLALVQDGRAAAAAITAPVPSLEPERTQAAWRQLADRSALRPFTVAADCRPLRAAFYAATDWLRLATTLASRASPCAQYYVSVPPVVADKTKPRPDQAAKIRALGPAFHALAEIHLTAWQKWVASTGTSWYGAGDEARRRMAAAGYDVASGDTWALNELTSAVRRGDGTSRTDIREFLRGLFDAGGEGPQTRGVVFVIGIGQKAADVSTYKARMQEWLQDSAFWIDMNTYVSDWSQEVYADLRGYAVPGAATDVRRDTLVDYLRHSDLLAIAGTGASGTANAFFANASSPLANAAWQWETGFGWTFGPGELMRQFVSAQVYALRNSSVRTGRESDHWGFAWAPRNTAALPAADFTAETGAILDRLAAAIRDSAVDTPSDPGSRACGPTGQNQWCAGDLEGATLTDKWRTFRSWSPTTLAFVGGSNTIGAGAVSPPIGLQAQVAGVATRPAAPVVATLSSSSPTGLLSTSATGPFTPTLAVQLPAASFATVQVYYQDTTAGTATLSATANGVVTGTRAIVVGGAPAVSLEIDPPSATLIPGGTVKLTAIGIDQFGNRTPSAATVWTLSPDAPGAIVPTSGASTTFTAAERVGTAQVTATVATPTGTLTATASVTVEPPPGMRVSAVRYGVARKLLHVYVTVVDEGGRRVRTAKVTVALYRNAKVVARALGPTAKGYMTFSRPAAQGAYRTRVTQVLAPGLVWNGKTPPNSFRKAQRKPA